MTAPQICIIASYAKSGSNWTRMVVENYLADSSQPVDIWSANRICNCLSRMDLEQTLFLPSMFLSSEEIEALLPEYFRVVNRGATEPVYYKLHDANYSNSRGEWIFPKEVIKGAVYLIRDPLDVVVSFSHHFGMTIDATIDRLNKSNARFNNLDNDICGELPIRSLTWKDHVLSWLEETHFPVSLVRYEDLLADPVAGFTRVLEGLGVHTPNPEQVKKAVAFCTFDRMKKQETESGKVFQAHKGGSFFRKGKSGTWKETLTDQQIHRIWQNNGDVMPRFGYGEHEG